MQLAVNIHENVLSSGNKFIFQCVAGKPANYFKTLMGMAPG
jgi:hypothetical protein